MNPIPHNENERLLALDSYNLLDTINEVEFDRLTELASIICEVPIALISLIDKDRQWFKSRVGLPVPQTPREVSFCQFAIMGQDIFEINDATKDERFKNNPLVTGAPDIKFYAGYPLIDNKGFALGTLCVIDREPKKLNPNQLKALEILGQEVISQIISRKERAELYDYNNLFKSSVDMVCVASTDGFFKRVNPAFTLVLGWTEKELLETSFLDLVHPEDLEQTVNEIEKLARGNKTIDFVNRFRMKNGEYLIFQWVANPDRTTGKLYAIARDITDIKKNEEDLILNLDKVNNLKKALNESAIVARTDENFKITYVNEKFCKISKYSREELIGKDHAILNSGFHTKEFMTNLMKTILSGNVWKGEIKNKDKEGGFYWVDTTIVPFAKRGQKPHQYIAIRNDITALKNKEEEIRKLLEYQRSILNGTDYSIIGTDTDGKIVTFNKGAQDLLGYAEEEIVGKHSPEIFHDKTEVVNRAEILSKEFNKEIMPGFEVFVIKSKCGKPDVNEWTYIKKDGSRVNVVLSVTTLYDSSNEIYGYLGVARDITETKKNQELLKFSEERHRLFFENSQGLMCTHDKNGKFLTINTAGANLIGYTPKELLEMTLFDATPANAKKRVQKYIDTVFNTGKDEGLMKVVHKNGSIKIWYYKNILVKEANGDSIVIGNAIDISDIIEKEKELKIAKMIAEKSVLAKDQFLANMSHEIRTPMNAILGFTDILRETKLDSEQSEYLSAISNSGENLMVIINDILDFSKIESGHLAIEKMPISIRNICNDVKKLLAHRANDRNIQLNFYIESELPNLVLGDSVRLNQILINLLGNAIKFTEQGKVELFCQTISQSQENCQLQFIIKDTGIGIPKNKQEQIFERFKQADDNTTRKFGGTGLGLSITKKLVELFEGTIGVKSVEGEGSEFIVNIPFKIAQEIKPTISTTQLIEKETQSYEILLTEDNILNQKFALHILNSNKMKVVVASNGQEAVEILKTKSFDVILMDLQMPIMDGYVATSIIRTVLKIKTPIIAMTAHSLTGEREKCLEKGMDDYISKPYKAKDLIDKIRGLNISSQQISIEKKEHTDAGLNYNLTDILELSGDDESFVKEMVNIFIKEVPIEMNKLSALIKENDFENVKKIAHKVKSSFILFKIDENVELCTKIELAENLKTILPDFEKLNKNTSTILEIIKHDLMKEYND